MPADHPGRVRGEIGVADMPIFVAAQERAADQRVVVVSQGPQQLGGSSFGR
ncbi:Uncharacterised protein [Mycobacteroides abscessus subsp. abscessus]|nr:Uncharacterised protein [Mycobacteroides abscessus subsp. abscessus]